MQVRKFEATTMRDAVSAVKKELGINAVILSTKEVSPAAPHMPKLYEVTAAAAVSSKPGALSANIGAMSQSDQQYPRDQEMTQKLSFLEESMATAKNLRLVEGTVFEIRNMLVELMRERTEANQVPAPIFFIETILQSNGVDQGILTELRRHLLSQPSPAEISKVAGDAIEDYFLEKASRWLVKRLKIAPKWVQTPGLTNVHVLLGAPGCGKTTLASKIATAISKKDRYKIGLISWDPEKLGASEQLRIYSKILGIDFVTISRAEELKPAILKQKGTDILVVDTAGRNPVDTQSMVDLELIRNQGLALEFHLVLSATEKSSLQDRAIRHFSTVGLSSVSFTKLDEISSWGDVFNSSCKWSVPVSWVGMSSDPSDIPERATRELVIAQILKNQR